MHPMLLLLLGPLCPHREQTVILSHSQLVAVEGELSTASALPSPMPPFMQLSPVNNKVWASTLGSPSSPVCGPETTLGRPVLHFPCLHAFDALQTKSTHKICMQQLGPLLIVLGLTYRNSAMPGESATVHASGKIWCCSTALGSRYYYQTQQEWG